MFTLTVNGAQVQTEQDGSLMELLRGMGLTSVKDGCGQGACGTCTVLADGKPVKACVQKISKFQGRAIVTVEGLSPREKEVYTYAFGAAGAVQCGFCIPGMVLCAKALLDRTPDPTEEQIRWAIRNNYCRCTGYVNIEQAVEAAADRMRRGEG